MQTAQHWLNRIHQSDCLRLMPQIPPGAVDLIVTSPPYNLLNSSGNGLASKRNGKWDNARLVDAYPTHNDRMPEADYISWQRRCLEQMLAILPEHGTIFYNHKWRVQNGRLQDRRQIVDGLPLRQIIIWQRAGGFNHNPGYFLPTYEVIYLIAKPQFRLSETGPQQTDIWRIPQERNNPHPAPFPLALARKAIAATQARTVLDPFCGSGTTALAAAAEGRNYIGIEIAAEYCRMAERRPNALNRPLPTPGSE